MAAGGLTYDDGSFFGSISGKYVGSQYSTFMDDQKMPAYGQMDLSIGYRFKDMAVLTRPTIQLNMTNVLNERNLGSIASPTGAAVPTVGIRGTTISASQPSYYQNAGFTAMLTIKSDF